MVMREQIIALYDERPKTDRDLIRENADVIGQALAREVTIVNIFAVVRANGFKGDRKKFTKILQEQGLYNIRKGHKKVEQPKGFARQPTVAAPPDHAPVQKRTKIWGGRYQKQIREAEAEAEKSQGNAQPADGERNILDVLRERNPRIFFH